VALFHEARQTDVMGLMVVLHCCIAKSFVTRTNMLIVDRVRELTVTTVFTTTRYGLGGPGRGSLETFKQICPENPNVVKIGGGDLGQFV
jgi:hypothetical protein